ncbi:MAG: M4 family metallopeptidase [Vicinamibacteria bacterium]
MHCSSRLLFVLGLTAGVGPVLASEPSPDAARRQRESIAAMPSVDVVYGDDGSVQGINGDTGLFLSDPGTTPMIVDHGAAALRVLGPALRAAGTERLSVRRVFPVKAGQRIVHYDESIRGIPVRGGLAIAIDAETGRVSSVGSRFVADDGLPAGPRLDEAAARRTLVEALVGSQFAEAGSVDVTEPPVLAYVKSQEDGAPALVWRVAASYAASREARDLREFWVNAVTGRVEGSEPLQQHAVASYTAGNQRPLHNLYPTGITSSFDQVALAATQNVANARAGWTSFLGHPTDIGDVGVVVHWGANVPEAFYSRSTQSPSVHWLTFGDGGPGFQPFGNSLDAVAHEWGHGLFFVAAGGWPLSSNERQAMAEAYADFSTVVVANRFAAGLATFEIAEDVRTSGVPLRSWSTPKFVDALAVDWYPHRFIGANPHYSITVMGHAFYLLSQGGTHYRAGLGVPVITVPGIGFGAAAEIFYWSMIHPDFQNVSSFVGLRQVTEKVADAFYPGGTTRQAVSAAWDAVGVKYGCVAPPAVPTLEIIDFMCGGHHILNWAPVPGATTYFAEKVPQGWPWSLAKPATDGPFNSCNQDVPSPFRIRLQSCNGCGCSPFGPAALLQFYQQCL